MRLFLFGAGGVAVEGNSREAVIIREIAIRILEQRQKTKKDSDVFLKKPTQQTNGPLRPLKG